MNKLKLKQKIGMGFGLLLAILAVSGYFAYSSIEKLAMISSAVDSIQQKVILARRVEFDTEWRSNVTRGYIITGQSSVLLMRDAGAADLKQAFDELENTVTTEEGKKLLAQLKAHIEEAAKLQEFAIEYRKNNDAKGAQDELFSDTADQTRADLRKSLTDFTGL